MSLPDVCSIHVPIQYYVYTVREELHSRSSRRLRSIKVKSTMGDAYRCEHSLGMKGWENVSERPNTRDIIY